MKPRLSRLCVVGAILGLCLAACNRHELKLEMSREVVLVPPKITTLTAEPNGRINTRGREQEIKVVMMGDPALQADFEAKVGQKSMGGSMKETQPGTYEGSFKVPEGQEGSVDLVARLRHESGARNETRKDAVLQLYREAEVVAPPVEQAGQAPTVPCAASVAQALEEQLHSLTVLFEFNKADLNQQALSALRSAGAALGGHPDCRIEVDGHTDQIGSEDYNLGLSERRAASVVDFLTTQLQIPAARLQPRAFGKSRPVETSKDASAQSRNRRVELHVARD